MSSEVRPFEALEHVQSHGRYQVLSLIWLWLSFSSSVWYLYLLAPSFANDLWWPNYNASGSQAFLIDSINYLLQGNPHMGIVEITSVLTDQDYGATYSYPKVYPAEGVAILSHQLTALSHAIPALRNMSTKYALWIPTQYCWVDFNRQWEIATSDQRQERCNTKFGTNAAVYLEAVLRNTKWSKFIATFGGSGNLFTIGIQLALEETKTGQLWLNTTANCNTSLADELMYWKSFQLTSFQIQWQNAILTGVDENIVLVNAFGIEKPVQIMSTAKIAGPWTSVIFNVFFSNDLLFIVEMCNASLVRQSSRYFANIGCYQPPTFETLMGLYDTHGQYVQQPGLIRDNIGPFLSVDLWVLNVPTQLVKLVSLFDNTLTTNILNSNTLRTIYKNLATYSFSPMPPKWNGDYYYYGGNPMCLTGSAQIFPQRSFTTTDTCTTPLPFTMSPSKRSLLFGLTMSTDSTSTICRHDTSTDCQTFLSQASAVRFSVSIDSFTVSNVTNTIGILNISLMQFASDYNQTQWSLLLQPLLLGEWAFYGWSMLYDWTIGTREVVAFDGDNNTLVLMSEEYPTISNSPSVDTMTHSSYVILYLVTYFSVILGLLAVAITVAAIACRFKFDSRNIVFFYRIGGSTWLGRPLMFLRGCTAILLLSTAPLVLTNNQGLTKFEPTRRSWVETLVLINEANWTTYVVTEVLLLLNPKGIQVSGCLSSCVVWLIYLCLDVLVPISVTTQLSRTCSVQDVYLQLHCSGSSISIGNYTRACILLGVPLLVVPVMTFWVSILKIRHIDIHIADYPGVAQAFFSSGAKDPIANLLAGLVPWTKKRIFNFNLWLLTSGAITSPKVNQLPPGEILVSQWHVWNQRMWIAAGTVYIVASIYSSVSYLDIAQVNWANDLIWPGFNMTGTHLFLANWFIRSITSGAPVGLYQLNQPSLNSLAAYNLSSTVLIPSHGYGFRVHFTNLTTLMDAIQGLRQSDACMAPWIFTQYCYVDFQQRWEMANSPKRQLRCASMVHNGAVFLESLLRNVQWDVWLTCWGDAFNIGIAQELKSTTSGQSFLNTLSTDKLSIADEMNYWNHFGIDNYELQWQNYKYIGIVNTYSIINAYGGQYSFTIQATPGDFRWHHQTTFKMYWGFGNDLIALITNTTSMAGKSLIRSSSNFAFANTTLQQIFIENGTILSSPLSAGAIVPVNNLGPFGSIDLKYVRVPDTLSYAVYYTIDTLYTLRANSDHLANIFAALVLPPLMAPTPQLWLDTKFLTIGGSFLCPPASTAFFSEISHGLLQQFEYTRECVLNQLLTHLTAQAEHVLFGMYMASIDNNTNLSSICNQAVGQEQACTTAIKVGLPLISAAQAQILNNSFVNDAYETVKSMNIQLIQIGALNYSSPMTLYQISLFDTNHSSFDLFAWILIYDWILGNREILSFQGDVTQMTLLGDSNTNTFQTIDQRELPVVFSLYALRAIEYVTLVMILIAILTALYLIVCQCHVAAGSTLELSRIGGIVWLGRPLLFARGITALSLLATSTLRLELNGQLTSLSAGALPWYTTCLAANEVTWLGGIVTDIGLIFSTDYAIYYSTWNSILIWIVTACLTILVPVQHQAKYSPKCQIVILDYQIECDSGSIAIGSLERFGVLIGIVVVSNVFCYGLTRYIWPNVSPRRGESVLLSAGAKYLLDSDDWVVGGVYYMDRATAVLDGLLSLQHRGIIYVFDVKSWKMHAIKHQDNKALDKRLQLAIPLPP